jgi:hypothetical protein
MGIGEPNPSYDLDVNGIVRADAYYWDTAAPQQTPSDSRLKTKVTPLPPQSDRIRDVNLVEFEWSELNDTSGLLIPLIKTVQEQQKQIDELKKLISGEE